MVLIGQQVPFPLAWLGTVACMYVENLGSNLFFPKERKFFPVGFGLEIN